MTVLRLVTVLLSFDGDAGGVILASAPGGFTGNGASGCLNMSRGWRRMGGEHVGRVLYRVQQTLPAPRL